MKIRLDQLVCDRGFASDRDAANRLILAGKIEVDGQVSDKPGKSFAGDARVELRRDPNPYVSRGGLKLAGALERLGVEVPRDCLALDIGASTGGFTDCLLQKGAREVTAVDVGHGQIHERLRADPRVRVLDRTNARHLTLEAIGREPANLITIDVSFISLELILPVCPPLLAPGGQVIALVKPQFEARREQVGAGGIVRDPEVHREVLERVTAHGLSHGWIVKGLVPSPILGAEGNVEFFTRLGRKEKTEVGDAESGAERDAAKIHVEQALRDAYNFPSG